MPEIKCKHQILFLSLKRKKTYCHKSQPPPPRLLVFCFFFPFLRLRCCCESQRWIQWGCFHSATESFACDYSNPMEKITLLLAGEYLQTGLMVILEVMGVFKQHLDGWKSSVRSQNYRCGSQFSDSVCGNNRASAIRPTIRWGWKLDLMGQSWWQIRILLIAFLLHISQRLCLNYSSFWNQR